MSTPTLARAYRHRRLAIGRLLLRLAIACAVVEISFLVLAELAEEALHPFLGQPEIALALAIHSHSSPTLTTLFLALTAIGTVTGTTPIVLATSAYCVARRWWLRAVWLVGVVIGASVLELLTKLVTMRARPELFRLASATGYSFPSGHATTATCLYVGLALILWSRAGRGARIILVVLGCLMPIGIGFSRVYLGVHYPSDVVGGWVVGTLWLIAARAILARTARQLKPAQSR